MPGPLSAIKQFFEKKKVDKKFKKAGEGHSLAGSSPSYSARNYRPQNVGGAPSAVNRSLSNEQRRAAEAAEARANRPTTSGVRTGKAAIKAQVQRELEAERNALKQAESYSQGPTEVKLNAAQVVNACGGVFYTSSLMPNVMLPKKEMEEKIIEYLKEQLAEDAEMASALLICTANTSKEKVKTCIETLCKYIDNLIEHPTEEKFRKIRCSNKAFVDRVKSLQGGTEFLTCSGYKLEKQPFQDGEEDFYVISEEAALDKQRLEHLKEVLLNAEPIRAELWRALRVFHCPRAAPSFGELPSEFYAISKEELKREQQARQEAVEKLGMLRTKAMRERDELRELRRYRYTLIRVRFPDDIYLQAIFKATEALSTLQDYIKEKLEYDWLPFTLLTANGTQLTEESKTLAELHLVPAVLLQFSYDKTMLEGSDRKSVLLDALLDRLEDWSI